MALLETWRKLAYETEMNQNQATEFWNSYFVQEKAIYEQILATPDAPVSGTVKELADKFGVDRKSTRRNSSHAKSRMPSSP